VSVDRLRIATWNIASNRNWDAIVARLAALEADLCVLQEVTLDCGAALPAILGRRASLAGYDWHFAPALASPGRAPLAPFGLAVLSRFPLARTAAFPLGPEDPGPVLDAEHEPRLLQLASLPSPRPLIVGNTHLAATDDWSLSPVRRAQAGRIADIVRPLTQLATVVVCGDFNTGPASSDLAELRAVLPHVHAGREATFVGEPARPPIDFFCASAPLRAHISVHPPDGLSDHQLVVASLPGFSLA
jgi:endonuclease/exonuclease/phosphatase family metal-dependent hydrolase